MEGWRAGKAAVRHRGTILELGLLIQVFLLERDTVLSAVSIQGAQIDKKSTLTAYPSCYPRSLMGPGYLYSPNLLG